MCCRNITKDSFPLNSSQFSLSAKILSRYYDFRITWDWGGLPVSILYISHGIKSNYPPLPASSQFLTPFDACYADQSNFLFPCSVSAVVVVLFDQYRFLKQPEKKMCEGDRLWLALRFKALHCFKVSFGSPVPRDGSTVSSFSDECNSILLKDSTSCINQMSPSSKLALYF